MSDESADHQDRPYWLDVPEAGVYLGFTRGEWPIQAFAQESQAAYWASEGPDDRRIIGPVPIPDEAPIFKGVKIAERRLERIQ